MPIVLNSCKPRFILCCSLYLYTYHDFVLSSLSSLRILVYIIFLSNLAPIYILFCLISSSDTYYLMALYLLLVFAEAIFTAFLYNLEHASILTYAPPENYFLPYYPPLEAIT